LEKRKVGEEIDMRTNVKAKARAKTKLRVPLAVMAGNIGAALLLFMATAASAVCPLCAVAVGAGIGFTQWLGVDDTITGTWLGGMIVALIIWTITWLDKKNIRFFGRKILVVLGYYVLFILPLYWQGFVGHLLNKLWGWDKLLLGIVCGSVLFVIGAAIYNYLKEHHGGRAYFPFQKVVMPIIPLVFLSVIFYFLTK
jgi:hypothetical protein